MRTALLLVLAASVAAPVAATSIYIDDSDWTVSAATEYEMVDETDIVLLARAAGTIGDEVRFKIEEPLKGDIGRAVSLHTLSDAAEGGLYIFFLNRRDDQWILTDFGFAEVVTENHDWFEVLRLFAGISALDDEVGEKRALRELREAALADPDRYPGTLVRTIDLHFGSPTPGKSFSDLMDLYDTAETDGERLAVLRALRNGEYPETAAFFRGLLLGGEPLWLMEPVLAWMQSASGDDGDDVPLLKDLARVWLGHPGEDRADLLELMLEIAEPEDSPLLWSLLPTADLVEKETIVNHVLSGKGPNPFAGRLRLRPNDPLLADLFLLWLRDNAGIEADARLEALLRRSATRDWRSVAGLEELLSAWEASHKPAERREIVMETVRRLDEKGVGEDQQIAALWRLVRQAPLQEVEALLHAVYSLVGNEEKLAALYRATSGEEEKNRALWFLLAAQGQEEDLEPLLSAAGALGEGPLRLERVARAFLTCPSRTVRFDLAYLLDEELAVPGDFLTMVEVLGGASLEEARTLAPWFVRHPGPEALPYLWRLPFPSLHLEPELTEALAASGDPEVLDMALDLRQRVATDYSSWGFRVLARSPLPAALEEARAIAEGGEYSWAQLMRQLEKEDNVSPWREDFLREVASSESVDERTRKDALTWLKFSEQPEP